MGDQWKKPQIERRRTLLRALLKKFPDTGHRTLARKLHDEHPLLFPNLENARRALRHVTGNGGAIKRRELADKSLLRAPRKPGELPPLPSSACKPWEPFVVDARRVLVLSDLHFPYHDPEALKAALDYGDKFKPDAVLLNGDVFDFYQLSRFDRDPTKPKLKREIKAGRRFFHHLRERYPRAGIYFKLGNHDERLDKYLMLNAPELFNIREVRYAWHKPAGIRKYGVIVIDDQRPVMLGKLTVLHGHEKGRGISSPVNPARGAFLRLLTSVLEGHGHRTSEHTERTFDGRVIACRTTGCLCGLWPEYARANRWDHSFATVEVDASGDYRVELHRIIDGKVR